MRDAVINAFKCFLYKFFLVLIKMPRDSITFMDASYKTLHISLLFVFCGWPNSFIFDDERRKPRGTRITSFFADRKMKRK